MLKHKQDSTGFTIVESLMAIVVLGILMSAIAPVIVLTTANRVQARRVELATEAARAYIDGVKSGVISHPPIGNTVNLEDYDAPTSTGTLNCTANSYCSSPDLYCIDFDGSSCSTSSLTDMVVQAVRLNAAATDADRGYLLGLRVYRADAFKNIGPLKKGTQQATFTGGLGDAQAPMLEMRTEVDTDKTSFRDFCDRLGCGNTNEK